jgi:hypothetical protein
VSDLDQLRDIGQHLRRPAFEALLDVRRRRTRRSRLATGALTLAATVAVVGVMVGTGESTRSGPSPTNPTPMPTPSRTVDLVVPTGQQTVSPEILPGDIHGFDVLATLTNAQPAHRGASELSTTVATHDGFAQVSTYCRADRDLWYFYNREDGAFGFDRCTPDAETTLHPDGYIDDEASSDPGETLSMRMWIARPSATYLDCFHGPTPDCNAVYGLPQPVNDLEAEFGFRVYEHRAARPVLAILDGAQSGALSSEPYAFEALSAIRGIGWLVDRAVIAAPDADRLAFELPASDREHLVDVYERPSHRYERCLTQHRDELPDFETTQSRVYSAAVDKVCGADLRLVVDGTPVPPDRRDDVDKGHFSDLGVRLPAGAVQRIEVEVARGDPRNVQYAVVVRTRTELP